MTAAAIKVIGVLVVAAVTFFALTRLSSGGVGLRRNIDDQEFPDHVEDHVQNMIDEHPIVIIYHSHCPDCLMVENKIRKKTNNNYAVFDLIKHDSHDDAEQIRQFLAKKTGRKVVPWIFIDGKFVGERRVIDQLDATGELDKMIEKALRRKEEL